MTDPKIVTDADTVIRLSKKAKAIARILGGDQVVMIEPKDGDAPWVACVGEQYDDGSSVAVAIEGGDIWHYDPDTDTGTPAPKAAAAAVVDVHPTGVDGDDHFAGGSCFCLYDCCNDREGDCTCRWGCVGVGHGHF